MRQTTKQRRVMPDSVVTLRGIRPVTGWTIYAPGYAPKGAPVAGDMTTVRADTDAGPRWFGFVEAFIGSDLRVHVAGGFADCENARGWDLEDYP